MKPWERRLKDLSLILESCEKNYFEPELFRLNLNNFLQTSRTITFVIQKNKAIIPGYDKWYPEYMKEWSDDEIMCWAKESRNVVEKEGDLDLYSSLSVCIVSSYFEREDVKIEVEKYEYLFSAVKTLVKYVKRYGGNIDNEEWVIKVERKWIANSLPKYELLFVLNFIYSKMYRICNHISSLFSSTIDSTVLVPDEFHIKGHLAKRDLFIDIDSEVPIEFRHQRIQRDEKLKESALLRIHKERWESCDSFDSYFAAIEQNAKELFEKDGYHVPFIYLFDCNNKLHDTVPFVFDKRYKKFLIWRDVVDRITLFDFGFIIVVSEQWIKAMPSGKISSIVNLENIGEVLDISAMTREGTCRYSSFEIIRKDGKATIGKRKEYELKEIPQYFKLVLEKISSI
jgi:hypothetical protein